MLAPPGDLDIAELTAALANGWDISDPTFDYLAVGFGSHHWSVTDRDERRWFGTVDEHRHGASSIADLRGAFATASALHRAAGLSFVVAPIADSLGDIIRVLGGGAFTVAVTPWLDAAPLSESGRVPAEDRSEVLRMLGQLHRATPHIGASVPLPIDLSLPDKDDLRAALDDVDTPWASGPYGESTRALLSSDAARLADALAGYDHLVECVVSESTPWVVTHGEPHAANLLRGADGALHLIDWDTVRLAPRERDLGMVIESRTDLEPYRAEIGDVPISAAALRLFRMRWDLGEIATYVSQFHAPHEDDPNTRESWQNLGDYLPVHADHLAPVSD